MECKTSLVHALDMATLSTRCIALSTVYNPSCYGLYFHLLSVIGLVYVNPHGTRSGPENGMFTVVVLLKLTNE